MVPKRTEFLVFIGSLFYSLEVDGLGVTVSSGEAARDPVGVLPSSSSFFSAFSILFHCVSSLLMAAPLLRSINLDVEMSNFAATSCTVLGLYFCLLSTFFCSFQNLASSYIQWPGLFKTVPHFRAHAKVHPHMGVH